MSLIQERGVNQRRSKLLDEDQDELKHELDHIDDFELINRLREQNKIISLPKQTKLRLLNSLHVKKEFLPKTPSQQKNPVINDFNYDPYDSHAFSLQRNSLSPNLNPTELRKYLEAILQQQIQKQAFLSSFGTLAAILFWNFNITMGKYLKKKLLNNLIIKNNFFKMVWKELYLFVL